MSGLYLKMDASLKRAFYTCFRNFGKISTKKLLACFVDPKAIAVADQIIKLTSYEGVPSREDIQVYDATSLPDDIEWLQQLPVGPGVSPCVMRTCDRILQQENNDDIDTLHFLQVLSATANELSRLVQDNKLDVPRLVAEARAENALEQS